MKQDTVTVLAIDAQQTVIAAHRYLAFLDRERSFLVHEMYPERDRDDAFFVPVDRGVNVLQSRYIDASGPSSAARLLLPRISSY